MARSTEQIQQLLIDAYVTNMALIGITVDPTTWSATDLRRMFIYVVAYCSATLEQVFEQFTTDNNAAISEMKPHTSHWYASTSKDFQYGFPFLGETFLFDNTGKTQTEIDASKIIAYVAVIEVANNFGRVFLRFKLAKYDGTDLIKLSADELTAFSDWRNHRYKDAGVPLIIDSLDPDGLKETWTIYYDPLILNSDGSRIDGTTATPVKDAIKLYLLQAEQGGAMPFNGVFVPEYHEDFVELTEGVVIAKLNSCEAQFGLLPYTQVGDTYTADAGYLRFLNDADLVINYVPQSPIK